MVPLSPTKGLPPRSRISRVRVFCPILVLFALLLFAAISAPADVIHLKNGRTIWADQIREDKDKDRLEYDIGENTYAIPKSSVERIESGGVAPAHAGSGTAASAVSDFTPSAPAIDHEGDVAQKILRDGKVDADALAELEHSGNSDLAATGYFLAGKTEFDRGNFPQAKAYYDAALRFEPNNSTLLLYYAACLLRSGQAALALPYAQRAVQNAPESPDTLAMLGFAESATDHTAEAIQYWKKSLALRPDPKVKEYLEKAERESQAESNFSEHESSHFNLHFEGKDTSESFRRELLATLDSDFDDLVRDLGYSPHDPIVVTLYTREAFFDVTRAPSWSGALNDGKLRIPVSGMSSVTPDLARVLKHELTHSFVSQISSNRCPTWLNEGVAQMEEGKSSASNGHALAQMFSANAEIPYNMLEGGFTSFSGAEANVAYAESLAAAEYVRDTYGMGEIQRILERLGQGSSTEAALRGTIHSDYGQLTDEMSKWLSDRYGK